MKDVDGAVPGNGHALVELFARLREANGNPSLTVIASRIPSRGKKNAARSYLSEIFRGRKFPSGDRAEAIALALLASDRDVDQARFLAESARERSGPDTAGGGEPTGAGRYEREVQGFLDFYTAVFVGRDRELTEILAATAHSDGRYVIVEAPAGYGKSALAAQLIVRHRARGWPGRQPNLIYYLVRQDGERNTAEAFYSAVNSQLQDLLREAMTVNQDARQRFRELWSRAAAEARSGRPLILLVDGLDEVAASGTAIVDLLPTDTGRHVSVIVTSRPSPDVTSRVPLDHPLRRGIRLSLGDFDEPEIAMLLRHFGSQHVSEREVRRILKVTRGQPLFARFVTEDVAAGNAYVLAAMADHPPAGVSEYFSWQISQLTSAADRTITWDALALLVATRGPISRPDLAGALGWSADRAARALRPIERFLIGRNQVELMHREMRRAIASHLPADSCPE